MDYNKLSNKELCIFYVLASSYTPLPYHDASGQLVKSVLEERLNIIEAYWKRFYPCVDNSEHVFELITYRSRWGGSLKEIQKHMCSKCNLVMEDIATSQEEVKFFLEG